ncbi:MAG: di-heme oxidoredictase family protein [Deltaproteobacteria bacterium]
MSARGAAQADINEARPGGETTNTLLFGPNAFLPAASNITRENQRLFATGNGFFNQAWITAPASNDSRDGLGPLFNARACAECHFKDGRGRPPLEEGGGFVSMLLRLSVPGERDGDTVPEPNYGGQLQPFGVAGVPGEGAPRVLYRSVARQYADGEPYELLEPSYLIEAPAHGPLQNDLQVSPRVAPAMIGLGLLEAIDEARLLELTDPDDADGDGISGRVNLVRDIAANSVTVGRFGWKAEQPSVKQQSAGAFLGDIGVTSSLFPLRECSGTQLECQAAASGGEPEISDRLLERVARYAQLLAVPARLEYTVPAVLRGKARFAELDCDGCHVPSHRTAPDAELEEVRDQLIWPYTDLLLHDMGEGLSDHRPSAQASGNEWRTPPLWGLGHYPSVNDHDRLLHDGRARGVAEAVLWHDGEGAAAREAFVRLSVDERADLVAFVESL